MLAVAIGIVAPLGTAAMAGLGLAGGHVMVICTGDGLRLMTLGDDGRPIEISEDSEHCALVHASGTAVPAEPAARVHSVVPIDQKAPRIGLHRTKHLCLSSLPRAPPRH